SGGSGCAQTETEEDQIGVERAVPTSTWCRSDPRWIWTAGDAAVPPIAHDAFVGIEQIVKPVEQMDAGVDKCWTVAAADEREAARRQRICGVSNPKAVARDPGPRRWVRSQ